MKIKTFGYVLLAAAILVTASTPVVYIMANNINPIQLALLISLVGTVIGFFLMIAKGKQSHLKGIFRNRTQLFAMITVATLVFAGVTLIFSIATHYISASLTAVIYRTWPLMLLAITPLMLRERISKRDVVAMSIGFVALVLALFSNTSISIPLFALPFVGLVLVAALCDAFGSSIEKRYSYEIYSSIFVYNLIALIIFVVVAAFTGQLNLTGINTVDVYSILFLGLFQNVLLTFLFVISLRMLKTAVAGNAYLVTPFITMVLGYLILGEPILPAYIFVAGAVLLGMLIQKLAPRAGNYVNRSKGRASAGDAPTIYDITSAFVNTKNAKIYNVMKGSGRVLAFYKKGEVDHKKLRAALDAENAKGNSCMLLTSKTHPGEFTSEELEFIKDVIGHEHEDTVVIGAGHPDAVEQKLYAISNNWVGLALAAESD